MGSEGAHELPRGFKILPCTQAMLDVQDPHPLWEASGTVDGVTLIDLYA